MMKSFAREGFPNLVFLRDSDHDPVQAYDYWDLGRVLLTPSAFILVLPKNWRAFW